MWNDRHLCKKQDDAVDILRFNTLVPSSGMEANYETNWSHMNLPRNTHRNNIEKVTHKQIFVTKNLFVWVYNFILFSLVFYISYYWTKNTWQTINILTLCKGTFSFTPKIPKTYCRFAGIFLLTNCILKQEGKLLFVLSWHVIKNVTQ